MTARFPGLVGLLPRMRGPVAALRPDAPLRESAMAVASLAFGADAVEAATVGLVNLAALAINSRCQPATYLARPAASKLIHATDLHSIPDCPPRLLRAPGIVETRRPETGERLFGDYYSVGWYLFDDAICMLGLRVPDGFSFVPWRPKWTGEELEPQLHEESRPSPLINDLDLYNDFAREAAHYLVVLGLLAEVRDGPLRIELDKRERATRNIYYDEPPAPSRKEPAMDGTAGRVADETRVRGHVKRVRVGEGRTTVAWRYIRSYEARRWYGPRWAVERDGDPG